MAERISVRSAAELSDPASLADALADGVYQGYVYSYPHKTAYGWFDQPFPLAELWEAEPGRELSLYLHVPFCEMRCGFCNLFTTTNPAEDAEAAFVAALERQAAVVRDLLPAGTVVTQGAIGGGTPTLLASSHLERLLAVVTDRFGIDLHAAPFSVETSPDTATAERVAVLVAAGVRRVSIGIQSWVPDELRALGRPQDPVAAHRALERLRSDGPPRLNVDLMYGAAGQTPESLQHSIAETLRHQPDEVFLYPLYVRPLTGLGRGGRRLWDDQRLALYRSGRDVLLAAGYQQVSMRMFSRQPPPSERSATEAETDHELPGLGLGPGARSYTTAVHYATDWAVSRTEVRSIIDAYTKATTADHAVAAYGAILDGEDERRRFLLLGLLNTAGVDLHLYRTRFGTDPFVDVPELSALVDADLATEGTPRLRLTDRGIESSDAIGPWLYAPQVRRRMREFNVR